MAIAYINLETETYKIDKIQELRLTNKINEHSSLELKAVLTGEEGYSDVFNTSQGRQIDVYGDHKKELFKGVVTNIAVKKINNIFYLDLVGLSNTFLLDVKKKSRSFQDKSMLYVDMIKQVISDYPGSDMIDKASNLEKIGQYIMQLYESDWEFIKRMASHFHAGLVPSIKCNTPKFTFGIPEPTDRGKLERYNFYIKNDICAYMKSSQNNNPDLKSMDKVEFYVETTEEFEIGDRINYQNISLFVKEKAAELKNSVLFFHYALSTVNGLTVDKTFNSQIIGLSLKGKVLEVIQDTIKVHLEIDESQDVGKAWQFTYTTMYTAKGNSGWYCMPEVDDTVYINFPTKEEHEGVGINSVRELDKSGDKITDPEIKYFRTKDGKELMFSPDEIIITCCNGIDEETGEKFIVYIRLNESTGIDIISSKSITVQTDESIILNAGKEILIAAKEEIKMKCKTSEVKINKEIDIAGKIVRIN